ncbi:DEKNAAC101242 [Brettanomyces naardenensis]|uniref:DEKNAAC101242 n=1 Tax=Brettanomyces naardenensis TaxID=13370 RepID=A0A448YHR7_BRENA|nr:DEKNAAC101242 [Brettanomyces naardenensis]
MLLYRESAQFISSNPKKGSLLTRVFDAQKQKKLRSDPKHVYALVSSTLKYRPFIVELIKKSHLLTVERKAKIPEPVAILLVHDLLFSKSGRIQSRQHAWKDAVIRNKTRLHAELTKLRLKNHVKSLDELIEEDETPVRWFRANTIKTTQDKVLKEFGHLERVYSIDDVKKGTIYHDDYIPNLFGVNPREKITSTDAYLKGRIIIQDRASCFPAFILDPVPGVDKVIDACAAPGNKTTHLASILRNIPNSIIAFERDSVRVKTLKKMCDKAGGSACISIQHGDFTDTNPDDYPDVTAMLVDPSCSGSGIFGRAFEENDTAVDGKDSKENNPYTEERLEKLSNFQFAIVKHAMMFPNLKKLVYSTCSIYPQEDERVAIRLLEDADLKKRGWKFCKRENVIPKWPRRGRVEEFSSLPDPELCAGACVRSLPKVDGGIGFFAAAFERSEGGEEEDDDDDQDEQDEWTGFDD